MHIDVHGTLSGKLGVEGLSDSLSRVEEAQRMLALLGLKLEVEFDPPQETSSPIPADAPEPQLSNINDIEEALVRLSSAKEARQVRSWVLEHLGYFRVLGGEVQEAVMAYYAPGEEKMPTLQQTAQQLGITSTTVFHRIHQALTFMTGENGPLEKLRASYIEGLDPQDHQRILREPVAILDLSLELRQRLRRTRPRLRTVGDVVNCSMETLKERLEPDHIEADRVIKKVVLALDVWGLALKEVARAA